MFIPHMPVSTVSGRKIVDITVSTFITLIQTIRHGRQVHLVDPRHALLEQECFVGVPRHVVVDVAETKRHLVRDGGELPPREPADDVALRQDHPPQRAQLALQLDDLADDLLASRERLASRACRDGSSSSSIAGR